ncbi:NUDIX domain-containing protein [Lachnospiraceae bacterium 29-84]
MEKSPFTTLCYIENEGKYLMLHRVKKQKDVNKDKWIGIGGHFEPGESPEECLLREVEEETGLRLTHYAFRGIVTFYATGWQTEYMCLYTADGYEGTLLADCEEGTLEWVAKERLMSLNLWEGDKIFFRLLMEERPFFSLKLSYDGDRLTEAALDGTPLELLDIRREDGGRTGVVRERSMVHEDGDLHGTAHIWIVRPTERTGGVEVLMQKRSRTKESYPGCYDISSAGHLLAGSGYLESALRELEEELGIQAQPQDLEQAFWHLGYAEDTFYGKRFKNAEISAVYVYQKPVRIQELKLQEHEVEEVCWMPYGTLQKEVRQETEAGKAGKYCVFLDELEALGEWLSQHGMDPYGQRL